jgi:hypothetical protein
MPRWPWRKAYLPMKVMANSLRMTASIGHVDKAATFAHYGLTPRRRRPRRITMLCPSCGHENRPDRLYCAECGASLGLTSASCGTQNEPGENLCGRCGVSLTEAAPLARTPASTSTIPTAFADGAQGQQILVSESAARRDVPIGVGT